MKRLFYFANIDQFTRYIEFLFTICLPESSAATFKSAFAAAIALSASISAATSNLQRIFPHTLNCNFQWFYLHICFHHIQANAADKPYRRPTLNAPILLRKYEGANRFNNMVNNLNSPLVTEPIS